MLIGFVLLAMVGIGLNTYLTDFAATYGYSVDPNVTGALSDYNRTLIEGHDAWVNKFQNSTQAEQGIAETGGSSDVTPGTIQIVKQGYDLNSQTYRLIFGLPSVLGVPYWAMLGLSMILLIVMTIAVLSAILGKDN